MTTLASRLSAALLLCALAACSNDGKPQESGNMTNGPQASGGATAVDTAGSAITPSTSASTATPTVKTGAGTDTGSRPSCCSSQKADTSKKTP